VTTRVQTTRLPRRLLTVAYLPRGCADHIQGSLSGCSCSLLRIASGCRDGTQPDAPFSTGWGIEYPVTVDPEVCAFRNVWHASAGLMQSLQVVATTLPCVQACQAHAALLCCISSCQFGIAARCCVQATGVFASLEWGTVELVTAAFRRAVCGMPPPSLQQVSSCGLSTPRCWPTLADLRGLGATSVKTSVQAVKKPGALFEKPQGGRPCDNTNSVCT
jgi:hypothetical protein